MNDSLEHFDQTLQAKNQIVEELIERIKEANMEGLELQARVGLAVPLSHHRMDEEQQIIIPGLINDKHNDNQNTIKSPNRKIPVSLHELGNTVPTKRNPDGIWV